MASGYRTQPPYTQSGYRDFSMPQGLQRGPEQQQLTEADKQRIQALAQNLMQRASDAQKQQMMQNIASRLPPQRLAQMRAEGQNPLAMIFQQEATKRYMLARRAQMQQKQGILPTIDHPTSRTGIDADSDDSMPSSVFDDDNTYMDSPDADAHAMLHLNPKVQHMFPQQPVAQMNSAQENMQRQRLQALQQQQRQVMDSHGQLQQLLQAANPKFAQGKHPNQPGVISRGRRSLRQLNARSLAGIANKDTISKDNTAGEEAWEEKLLAHMVAKKVCRMP